MSTKKKVAQATHLDSSLMLIEGVQRSIAVSDCVDAGIPDQQQVIVSTASKVFSIRGPLEPTHFL